MTRVVRELIQQIFRIFRAAIKSITDASGDGFFEGIDASIYGIFVDFVPPWNYTKEVNTGVAARLETVKS